MPKITELTPQDLQNLKNKTPLSLPDNPSSKGFSASQIKEKMSGGFIYLFEKLQTTIKELNDYIDSNDTDIITINTTITGINMALTQLQSQVSALGITDTNIENQISQINSSIQELQDKINHISIEGDFATKEDLQNVIEIAEGKTKSYLLSCNDVIQEEFLPYMTYYNSRGEVLTNEQVLNIVNNGTCVNNLFNSQDNQVPVWDVSNWYLIIEYNYPVMQNNSKVIITNMDNPFKQGDILIVTETDVPDRYATDIGIFYKMETSKVDLSTVVHKSGDETISGVKTFSNKIKVQTGEIEATSTALAIRNNGANVIAFFSDRVETYQPVKTSKVDLGNQVDIRSNDYNGFVIYTLGYAQFTFYAGYCLFPSIYPSINDTYSLGQEGQYWKECLVNNIKSEGTAQYKKTRLLSESEYEALSEEEKNNGVIYNIYED